MSDNLDETMASADAAIAKADAALEAAEVPDSVSSETLQTYKSAAQVYTSDTDKYRTRNPLATPIVAGVCAVTALVVSIAAYVLFAPESAVDPVDDASAPTEEVISAPVVEAEPEPEPVEEEVVEES